MRVVDLEHEIDTTDLYFASYLFVLGRELVHLGKSKGKVYFIFGTKDRTKDRSDWISGSGQVSGKRYSEAVKTIRGMIHDAQDQRDDA